MAITFYYGSGSPYGWRVWLALEHKALAYEFKLLSFSGGDLDKPEFLALNPRHKIPVITDGDFSLYESAAIVEYLEDAYPDAKRALWPADVKQRAIARRMAREADLYLSPATQRLGRQIFFTSEAQQDEAAIAKARDEVVSEIEFFEKEIRGDFLVGALSAADFTLYPMLALVQRMEDKRRPSLAVAAAYGPKLKAWKARIEALPYFAKTVPPHWK